MKGYSANIISLSLKAHHFNYTLGDEFFGEYGADLVYGGKFSAEVILTKTEMFIEVHFNISGQARLVCDRSLEPFDYPLEIDKKMIFKYGDEESELSDQIIVIRHDRVTLDLGQYIYEFIVLEIPMKKLHPKFENFEEEDNEGKMVYSSSPDEDSGGDDVDPRWEQLKKLK